MSFNATLGIREYFDIEQVYDSLLKPKLTPHIIEDSSRFIEDLAMNYGITPNMIADPTPFKIEKLALFYAMQVTCLECTRMASTGEQDGADAYELKRRIYKSQLDDLLTEITADTFTNGESTIKFPHTIKVFG